MAPQDLQICGINFPKRKISAAALSQILRVVTIYIVINALTYSSRWAWQNPAGTTLHSRWYFCFL